MDKVFQLPDADTIKNALADAPVSDAWMAERVFPTVAKQLANQQLIQQGVKLRMHVAIHDAFKAMSDLDNPVLALVPMLIDDWTEAILEVSTAV